MKHHQRGFTLIELLVVIAIVAMLAVLVTQSLFRSRVTARNAKAMDDIAEAGKAIETYKQNSSTTGYVLAATIASPGANKFSLLPKTGNWLIPTAYAVAGLPPPTGDILTVANSADACNNHFLDMFTGAASPNYYPAQLGKPPSGFYTYSYRTQDVNAALLGAACPIGTPYHQQSAFPNYTVITNLDQSDGSPNAYFWVNNGTKGSTTSKAGVGIPAP